ncbi:hypothetical protein AB0I53_37455 [Saccharopolyspora sp. NPDC050389]
MNQPCIAIGEAAEIERDDESHIVRGLDQSLGPGSSERARVGSA